MDPQIDPAATERATHCACGDVHTTSRTVVACDEVTGALFTYHQCASCGLERIVQRPTRPAIRAYYPQNYYAYSGPVAVSRSFSDRLKRLAYLVFYAERAERSSLENTLRYVLMAVLFPLRFRTILAFRPPRVRRVFEFGAATGIDLMEFKAAGWEASGCEPSRDACAIAMQRGIALQNCSAEAAQLPEGHYSCIVLNNVLEHLHDPAGVLGKASLALVSGGDLVLIVPNHASWSARQFGSAWPGYDAPRHLWGFNPASIQALLRQTGFSVEYIHHVAPQRWCWAACLGGIRSPAGPTAARLLAARWLATFLVPVGLLAALCRHGDFIKIVATSDRVGSTASTLRLDADQLSTGLSNA